ncbi:hypothetical protein V6Z11_D05G271400 [Gossypium hirsutum]
MIVASGTLVCCSRHKGVLVSASLCTKMKHRQLYQSRMLFGEFRWLKQMYRCTISAESLHSI